MKKGYRKCFVSYAGAGLDFTGIFTVKEIKRARIRAKKQEEKEEKEWKKTRGY